ncbi:unnamed protein product [Caenorhabditis auriculariae]|uniref:Uncharacterized protein n=1 Tax=Caenorhabditis auriculariae TaxID=2777116 RepID=A0A8S1HES3_9PELO|nr:unnamed protein product [Caenorhabditis auriculariae]
MKSTPILATISSLTLQNCRCVDVLSGDSEELGCKCPTYHSSILQYAQRDFAEVNKADAATATILQWSKVTSFPPNKHVRTGLAKLKNCEEVRTRVQNILRCPKSGDSPQEINRNALYFFENLLEDAENVGKPKRKKCVEESVVLMPTALKTMLNVEKTTPHFFIHSSDLLAQLEAFDYQSNQKLMLIIPLSAEWDNKYDQKITNRVVEISQTASITIIPTIAYGTPTQSANILGTFQHWKKLENTQLKVVSPTSPVPSDQLNIMLLCTITDKGINASHQQWKLWADTVQLILPEVPKIDIIQPRNQPPAAPQRPQLPTSPAPNILSSQSGHHIKRREDTSSFCGGEVKKKK